MPFNLFLQSKAFGSTLGLVRWAVGERRPNFKHGMQQQAGRVRFLLNYEEQSADLKGEALNSGGRDTGRDAIGKTTVSGDTSTRMEEHSRLQGRSKLEESISKLYESLGSNAPPGLLGKTEGREPGPGSNRETKLPGSFEGGEEILGKAISQNDPSQREKTVPKLEQSFSPELRSGIVGKTEGRELGTTPDSLNSSFEALRVKGNVGKTGNESSPGKLDDETAHRREELPGAGLGKVNSGEAETADDLKVAGNLGKTRSSQSSECGQGKVEGNAEINPLGKGGSGHSGCVIQFASKGSAEEEYVEKVKRENGLHLPEGAVVRTAADSTDANGIEGFDVKAYLKHLPTSQFGRLVLYSPLIPSTHTLLSENYQSFPAGTICVAAAQMQGRGRGGNVWQSPKGCLMFSYTTQMTNGQMVPFLQYVVSLAVIGGIEETCKASGIPAPELRIKWPNDLYAKGLKIGGVLCTSTYRAKTFNIVVGVGLNVGNREPTTCLEALVEELQGESTAIEQELLLACTMSRFETLNKIFQEQGFSPLQEDYCRKWLHTGQSVVLEEREEGSSSVSHVAVTIHGLTPTGYLLASDDAGQQYELHPDGNSFDFLKGLVRQKLPV